MMLAKSSLSFTQKINENPQKVFKLTSNSLKNHFIINHLFATLQEWGFASYKNIRLSYLSDGSPRKNTAHRRNSNQNIMQQLIFITYEETKFQCKLRLDSIVKAPSATLTYGEHELPSNHVFSAFTQIEIL